MNYLIYFVLMISISGCLKSDPIDYQNKLLPIPEIYFDRDHDLLPDGIDPTPLMADLPEWRINAFYAKIKSKQKEIATIKLEQTPQEWGFRFENIIRYLQLHKDHPDSLLPVEIRPHLNLDLSHNLKFWTGLATVLTDQHQSELSWQANVQMSGTIQDRAVTEEIKWRFLDENKQHLGLSHSQAMSFVQHQGETQQINIKKAIKEVPNQHERGHIRYLQIELNKIKFYRQDKVVNITNFFQQLFERNVSLWIISNKGQNLYSFAPGLTISQMLQKIDPMLDWDENGRDLRQFLSLRQEIISWRDPLDQEHDTNTKGRWDVILNPNLSHDQTMIAGSHVFLVYSTIGDHRNYLNNAERSQNSITNILDKVAISKVEKFQKKLWKVKGTITEPEYEVTNNFVVKALVDIEISGELGNRGRKRALEGLCGIKYRSFKRMISKKVDVVLLSAAINGQLLKDDEWHRGPINDDNEFWLAVDARESGELELNWEREKFKQPDVLGFFTFSDCEHRFKGENFRFSNIDVGPWQNEHSAFLTLDVF